MSIYTMAMVITHKKATAAEKRELKKIARQLPEILVPIQVKEFHELGGELVPEIDMGIINQKGHYHNLVESIEQKGVKGVQEYVNAVNKRNEDYRTGKIG